jgi:RHS repeat-associated protein
MAYDTLGRMTSDSEPYGVLSYGYDAAGNRTVLLDNQGGTTSYVYDALNRVTAEEFTASGQPTLCVSLTYSARDQVATETRYDDLAMTMSAGMSSYVYDAAGRLTSLTQTSGSGAVLASYAYSYNQASRLTAETDNGVTTSYSYDGTSQLLQAGATGYGYDATGNRNTTGYVTGPDNELLNDGTWTYTYDNMGELTQKSNGSETWNYVYNNAGQMVSATETGTALRSETDSYDAEGNPVQVEQNSIPGIDLVTQFTYDGTNQYASANLFGLGGTWSRQFYLPAPDQLLARIDASGTAAWYLTDRQGSVRNIENYAGTSALDTISYDAYGTVTAETSPTNADAFKYDGYRQDSITGLYRTEWRQYDPTTGRWTTPDPKGFGAGDVNLERYVGNGPTDGTDPTGLDGIWDWNGTLAELKQRASAAIQAGVARASDFVLGRAAMAVSQTAANVTNTAFVAPVAVAAGAKIEFDRRWANPAFRKQFWWQFDFVLSVAMPAGGAAGEGEQIAAAALKEAAAARQTAATAEKAAEGALEAGQVAEATIAEGVAARSAPQGAPTLPAFSRNTGTQGVLRTAAGDVPLQSGVPGPARSIPNGTSGFDIVTRTHVEGHAAAVMRQQGLSQATVYINNPVICDSCMNLLPRMVPSGSRLTVVLPDGAAVTFTGGSNAVTSVLPGGTTVSWTVRAP